MNNVRLEAVIEASDRGWAVFPLLPQSKRPYRGSHGLRDATTKKEKLLDWWKQTPEANIGMATGGISDVFVLDVDPRNGGDKSLTTLEAKYGSLPITIEAATGGGGRHLFFQYPGRRVISRSLVPWRGLDIKGDGGYVVMPPSIHTTGTLYEWTHPPNETSIAEAPQWLLEQMYQVGFPESLKQSPSLPVSGNMTLSSIILKEAIQRTLPAEIGQRHRCVFDFARALKAMPEYASTDLKELRPIIRQWWESALPTIGTEPFIETWGDFANAWPRVRHSEGCGPMSEAIQRAKRGKLNIWRASLRTSQRCVSLKRQRPCFVLTCDEPGRDGSRPPVTP